MTGPRVAVLDYGSGNVHSVVNSVERAGGAATLTSDPAEVMDAAGLIVPGVGAFGAVMHQLRAVQADQLIANRLERGLAVFGICVGEQVLFDRGIEHGINTTGLELWPGVVRRLQAETLPHMGWSKVEVAEGSVLFLGIEKQHFYFVHSYAVVDWHPREESGRAEALVTYATHGERFVAAVEQGPLTATQFHPEKSGKAGLKLMQNWIGSLR